MTGERLDISVGVINETVADQANGATATGEVHALDGDVTAVALNAPTDTQALDGGTPKLSQQQLVSLSFLYNKILSASAPTPSASSNARQKGNQRQASASNILEPKETKSLQSINGGKPLNPHAPNLNGRQLGMLLTLLTGLHNTKRLENVPGIRNDDISTFLKMTGKAPLRRLGIFRAIGRSRHRPLDMYAGLNPHPAPTGTAPKMIYVKGEQTKTLDRNAAPLDPTLAPTQVRPNRRISAGLVMRPNMFRALKTTTEIDGEHLMRTPHLPPRPQRHYPAPGLG